MFLAYLQGIETTSAMKAYFNIEEFLAYLQGIETGVWGIGDDRSRLFLAYLQGIETLIENFAIHTDPCF